ncbi:hypothetical protein TanjilG_25676 [Lupinus angustifolius]|uniref:Glycosyltransferase n=2 Tax=Lupinus angustifolius TaxID=3871 RepID=A0A1J7IF96_LUPAN|nr:PREDICTED: hydroquinone glucosyltransferase-like isoform X1 [Lupinus angustifolius]XP_019440431.1 PREDICTED: hydroquinone glucosyltransferase-like isoform X1 [Lupinus angustifolius]XP_019440432.1 PREDICTED: hydroquinone glucosyltransferase-like isoform X2 [Lupinus angustifolius]OIW13577.1 hypothetical protein TanjilG_25676 [Lupinus angustifolius]
MEVPKQQLSLSPPPQPKQELASSPPQYVVVAMMPTPGMGHLIPMLEFAKRLIRYHHNIRVKFLIPTDGPPSKAQTTVLRNLPNAISHIFLPPVTLSDVPQDAKIETIISLTVLRSLPSLRREMTAEIHPIGGLVVDLFGADAFDVAKELDVSRYLFFPSNAMLLSFFLHLPKLDKETNCEYRELAEPIKISGCIPIHGKELLDPVQDRTNEAYQWILHHANRYREADGIIDNSFLELEPGPIKELQKYEPGKPPVYPVGPLVNMDGIVSEPGLECLRWLDEQPHGSVLFVCFGSGGTLSSVETNELALGLEMSDQRFLWVVKSPNDKIANASYFSADSKADPFDFLPKGFVERTKGRGYLVPGWAPQTQVLAHGSIGGFLSHCGWNSTLESVVNGVPLIAWPLFAEQKMNAFMLTQDIKVALRPNKNNSNGLVEREEIASVVKCLMEGEDGKKLRYRMKDLKDLAAKALSENGSSTKNISQLALKWTKKTSVAN